MKLRGEYSHFHWVPQNKCSDPGNSLKAVVMEPAVARGGRRGASAQEPKPAAHSDVDAKKLAGRRGRRRKCVTLGWSGRESSDPSPRRPILMQGAGCGRAQGPAGHQHPGGPGTGAIEAVLQPAFSRQGTFRLRNTRDVREEKAKATFMGCGRR